MMECLSITTQFHEYGDGGLQPCHGMWIIIRLHHPVGWSIHSQKQLVQWAVYVTAEFYACMLSG